MGLKSAAAGRDRRAGGEKQEQRDDHRRLPGLPEKEAQGHRIRILEREGEYREKQQRPQQPRQMSDEFHAWHIRPEGGRSGTTGAASDKAKRRHLVDAAARTPPAEPPISGRPSRAAPCPP